MILFRRCGVIEGRLSGQKILSWTLENAKKKKKIDGKNKSIILYLSNIHGIAHRQAFPA